jgi:hypothetical protein
MGFFKNLKLKNRFATRLGAALRARDKGMTIEQAWKYADELYPPTQEQMDYEARLRLEVQAKGRHGAFKN